MNKCIFTSATLAKDPDVRFTQTQLKIARFTIAVKRTSKKEGQPDADFLSCIAFDKKADFVEKYLKKGSRVDIDSFVQTGSYTNKDGVKVYTTDFIVNNIEFSYGNPQGGNNNQSTQNTQNNNSSNGLDQFMNIPEGIDEVLPFN